MFTFLFLLYLYCFLKENAQSLKQALEKVKGSNKSDEKGKGKTFNSMKSNSFNKKSSSFKPKTEGNGPSSDNKETGKRSFQGKGGKDKSYAKKPRQLTPEEQRSRKPNFALVQSMKKDWNVARMKTMPAVDRVAVINGLAKNISSHILQVTLRHDASRIVQCILQYGNSQQRKAVLKELAPRLYEVAKTPYGHFAVLKALTYCPEGYDD